MPSSRIPSPSRSQGARATPRRYKPRASRSVGSPARSTSSLKLSEVVRSRLEPFELSPMPTRRSILPDTSDIDVPTRKSWWKRLNDDTQDVMEMVKTKDPELNKRAIEDIIEVEVLSQEPKEYTFDIPESSDNESINSIVIPQRKLFTQKENLPTTKFDQIIDLRESPTKKQESQVVDDRTLNVGRKNLFNQGAKPISKPIFPLLNISADKTLTNKTKDLPANEPKARTKNLFGNQPQKKRKNIFTNFVMSDSEESEILEIQPKVFEFPKNQEQESTVISKVNREPSPSVSIDVEMDDWQLLPSSTMVEQQIEDALINTPSKKARLGKLSEITKSNTTVNKTKQSNRSVKNSSKLKEAEVNQSIVPANEELNHSVVSQNSTRRSLRNKDISVKKVSKDRNSRELSKTKDSKSNNASKIDVAAEAVLESDDRKIEESKNKSKRSKVSNAMSKIDQALQSDDDNDFTLEYEDEPLREDGGNKTTIENKTQNQQLSLKHAQNSSSNNISKLQSGAFKKSQVDTEEASKTLQPEADHEIEPVKNISSNEKCNVTIKKTIGNIAQNKSPRDLNESSQKQDEINESNSSTIRKTLTVDLGMVNKTHDNEDKANEEKLKKFNDSDKDQVENYGAVQDNIETKDNQVTDENSVQSFRQEIENDESKTEENQDISEAAEEAHEADDNDKSIRDEVESEEEEDIEENQERSDPESEEEQENNKSEQNVTQESENEEEDNEQENNEESETQDEEQANESDHNISQEVENDDEENEEENQSDIEAQEEDQQKTNESEQNVSQEIEDNDEANQNRSEDNDDDEEEQTNENEQNISQDIENDGEDSQEENEESMAVEEEENESVQHENEDESMAVDEEQEENESAQQDMSVDNEEYDDEEIDQASDPENESHDEVENNDGNDSDDVDGIPDTEDSEEVNATHDTTGKHRQKPVKVASPEVVLHDKTNQMTSFTVQGRNTSVRNTKSMIKPSIKPSMAPVRESTVFSDGMANSSAEGSGWDSHRTTRTTLRKTFGRDFTPRKSLRALVMEKSAKRQTNIDISSIPRANSTELPGQFDMEHDHDDEELPESDHEMSRQTRQTTLETNLEKIKEQNLERRKQLREKIKNDLKVFRETNRRPNFLDPFKVPAVPKLRRVKAQPKSKAKEKTVISRDMLPAEILEDMKYKPPKRFRPTNASWITKRLYKYLETKLEPKYDYKARVRSEKLVETIYNFTKDIRRHPTAPTDAVNVLKREMARLNIVRTHHDFYEFFYEYMPREVRVKVVPDIINKIPVPKHVFSDILR